jgi:ketosteroid isomerase-like protein
MIKQLLGIILLITCAFGQTADRNADPQESKLIVLEHLWNEAQVHRDSGALAELIGDRFLNTEYDGEVSDRAKFLADIRDPQFKPIAVTIRDVKVILYQQTAVVAGVYQTKGSYKGKPYDHVGRFTDTWVYEKGKWQCVASHTSLLKK